VNLETLKNSLKEVHPELLLQINNDIYKLLKNNKLSTRDVVFRIINNNITKSVYCFLLNNVDDDYEELNLIDELVIEARNELVEKGVETFKNNELMKIIEKDLE